MKMLERMMRGRRSWCRQAVLLLAGCCLSLGCKADPAATSSAPAPAATPAPAAREPLVVFAAASLRDAFGGVKEEFLEAHANVDVTFNFAGTQDLRAQLEHGAAVDVFASADKQNMSELEASSRVSKSTVFARNEPVIVVSKERAGAVKGLADLPQLDKLVVGAPGVPIGRYTAQILANAAKAEPAKNPAFQGLGSDFQKRFEAKVASRELDVRQVLTKVTLGEADAGIVYRTDANSAKDKIAVVTIPPELNVIAEYPIAVVSAAPHPGPAGEWVKFVLSPAGQQLMGKLGFLPPAAAQ